MLPGATISGISRSQDSVSFDVELCILSFEFRRKCSKNLNPPEDAVGILEEFHEAALDLELASHQSVASTKLSC